MEKNCCLKICGITRLEDARYVAGAMADYIGFVFYAGSPRFISPKSAAEIIHWIEGPEKVGVFVNQSTEEINQIIEQTGIDLVQLHGDENPDEALKIRKPVIKSFRLHYDDSIDSILEMTEPWINVVDFFLFDTFSKNGYGGSGEQWNWSRIKDQNLKAPFFLSGGISVNNITEAVKSVKPFAVDLSSSVEYEPGVKDFEKLQDFFNRWNELTTE